jgi:membrane protease YdiL (CAAX protease family)
VKTPGAVLVFGMVYPTLMAWFYFVQLSQPSAEAQTTPARNLNPLVVAVYGAAKVFQFAFPVAWVWWFERKRIQPRLPQSAGLGIGLAFGVCVCLGAFAFYYVISHYTSYLEATPARIRGKIMEFGIEAAPWYILFGLCLSVFHSLLEEYYWRWFVFGGLRQHLSLVPAMGISGLAFMSHHVITLAVFLPGYFWEMAAPLALAIAAGGAFWAWLYDRSGSLIAPWLSHTVVDFGIMAIGYDMVFGS